jgi:cytochrome c biogenesis protein CcdA
MMMMSILLSFLAGVATITAPCTLPVLPILLGASIGSANGIRPIFIALGFVASFAAVALVFSVFIHGIGIEPETVRSLAVLLLLSFGSVLIWPRSWAWLSMRLGSLGFFKLETAERPGALGGLVLGLALGAVWTPCAGPVLASTLTLIATSQDLAWGGILLCVYAVGAAIPLLAIAYGGQVASTRIRSIARIAPRLQQGFGVLVIGCAAAIYFQYDTLITAWLSAFYPSGQVGL